MTLSGERTFKFLEEKHVQSLLCGTFLFRRLRYYQLLEMCTGDQCIGDKGEGIEVHTKGGYDGSLSGAPIEIQRLFGPRGFTGSGPEPHVQVGTIKQINRHQYFALCLAVGDLESLRRSFCWPDKADGYDGAVEITDIEALVNCLFCKGHFGPSPSQATTYLIRDHFARPSAHEIHYVPDPTNYQAADVPPPFLKDVRYRCQHEFRIALARVPPLSLALQDCIYVSCPESSQFMTRVPGFQSAPRDPLPSFDATACVERALRVAGECRPGVGGWDIRVAEVLRLYWDLRLHSLGSSKLTNSC